MKILDRFFENLFTAFNNMINQFYVDEIIITDEHIDYYKNYYLKGKPHPDFTTDKHEDI